MSRAIRKQLFHVLESLKAANKSLEEMQSQKNKEVIMEALTECQSGAIHLGERIEAICGMNTNSVRGLEVYCERIYEIAEHVNASTDWSAAYAVCNSLLNETGQYMEKELPNKLEAVFLPYKASMWDALESVWMAARDDEDCEAYVVPIPYYDKKPDGSAAEMHYEGEEFPDYVPVTDWRNYDIAVRRPDIIYIHNPYDGTNKVTTVHPDFYAKELKKHTGMLIYIPYFVCVNDEVPEHFCITPGTIHANRVIVQSEKVRETYIQEFRKFEEEYHCRGRFGDPEQKFIALGSPKYDKVFSTTRENVEIPEDWLQKIRKADGTWKKILLYNTSVTKLLEEKENMLEKIKAVFALMREREDIVLLWRPHPLCETTYAAARPQLLKEYEEIVESYKQEDWGIYDDTPELDRAIVISDAYYGDMSSLVELYRMTGKPVMIQDVKSI